MPASLPQPKFYHKTKVDKTVINTWNAIKSSPIRPPRQVITPSMGLQDFSTFEIVALAVAMVAKVAVVEVVVVSVELEVVVLSMSLQVLQHFLLCSDVHGSGLLSKSEHPLTQSP